MKCSSFHELVKYTWELWELDFGGGYLEVDADLLVF